MPGKGLAMLPGLRAHKNPGSADRQDAGVTIVSLRQDEQTSSALLNLMRQTWTREKHPDTITAQKKKTGGGAALLSEDIPQRNRCP